jgi:hypothetical protein
MEKPLPGQEKNLSSISAPSYHVVRSVAQLEQFVERISREKSLPWTWKRTPCFTTRKKYVCCRWPATVKTWLLIPSKSTTCPPWPPCSVTRRSARCSTVRIMTYAPSTVIFRSRSTTCSIPSWPACSWANGKPAWVRWSVNDLASNWTSAIRKRTGPSAPCPTA